MASDNHEMRGQLTSLPDIKKFMMSGKAHFTLASKKTGTRFTYKVKKAEDREMWFVNLLTGADNESDYQYFGYFYNELGASHAKPGKSRITPTAPGAMAFYWFLSVLASQDEEKMGLLEFWHEGRCGRCGRKLTVPSSIESGFGPECINHV